jgi:hypothetical protein
MRASEQSQVLKKVTKILAGTNVDVHMEGFAPRVEYDPVTKKPKAVYLPELPENVDPKLVNAIHGYLDHECGHILESDAEDICDSTKNKLWHFIHNCIEDPRVNAKMSERYPGSEANIRNGYKFLFERTDPTTGMNAYDKEHVDKIDLTNEEQLKDAQVNYSCMWFAKKANCRFNKDKYDELDLDRLFAPLEAKMDKRYLDALARAHSADEVKEATEYFVEFFHKEFDEDGSGGGSGTKGEKSKEASTKKHKGRLEDPKKAEDALSESILEEIEHLAKKAKQNLYFSDRFDRLHTKDEIAALPGKIPSIADFEAETKSITNYLTKDLRRLLESRNRRWYVGGYKSGRLNQKALHSVKVGNDRIFSKKSDIKAVKASVGLLIDMSGSMKGGKIDPDTGERSSKVKMACQSAYSFAMVLEQLKVPYEIWGFSTGMHDTGKERAYHEWSKGVSAETAGRVISPYTGEDYYAFKRFEENFDIISKQALVKTAHGKASMQNNEDSAHVKAALERLGARPEEKKTLFVFSDGMPSFAPGNIKRSHEQLMHLDAIAKEQYGVEMFGIGIQSDAVKNYYKNYKHVTELSELPSALFEFLRSRI